MENIVIIGSGPAGYTAAIYAARANLQPLVITGATPGGQLTQTTDIENFPGFPDGINGFDLMMQMQTQAEKFGTRVSFDEITSIQCNSNGSHKLTLGNGEIIESKAIIIATGAKPRWLEVPGEEQFKNKGVSACATCDGAFFKNVPVAVVGGGDTALEEATFLTRFASKVYLIHRRDSLRGSQAMQDRAKKNEKIEFVWDSTVEEIKGSNNVEKIVVKNLKTEAISEIQCNAIFMAIGHIPNTSLFEGQVAMKNGIIERPNYPRTNTNIEGVFVAGDCADDIYRQAICAAGLGAQAAIDAEHWLAAQE